MSESWSWRNAPRADFAVIGDPVSHSLSPRMHHAAYESLGLPYRYVAIQVHRGEVAQALEKLAGQGFRGVNVTVPHKEEALAWAKVAEPLAIRVRAANTLDLPKCSCINTDAPGFLDTLCDLPIPKKTALLIGAGGSARAIATALTDEGWDLQIHNRTHTRAVELAKSVGAKPVDALRVEDRFLIINGTSASLEGADLKVEWHEAPPEAIAYDLMYRSGGTPFSNSAASRGLRTVDGLELLVAQGARSFEWWLGLPAPRKAMREALD